MNTIDPIIPLEKLRREEARVSKQTFYGRDGIVHHLPVITLSARRKGVRLSAWNAYLATRTRPPTKTS
jgi:hypothetical protein